MEKRRQPEVIAGRVNADGSIASGDGLFTVSNPLTGAYDLTFAPGFRIIGFAASPVGAYGFVASDLYSGGNRLRVLTVNTTAGASIALSFSFIAVGVQT